MADREKFIEMVEKRMVQYDNVLRMIEPLARNYDYQTQDINDMIQYMRQGIEKLESLFLSGGKVGGFRFKSPPDAKSLMDSADITPDPTPIRKAQ